LHCLPLISPAACGGGAFLGENLMGLPLQEQLLNPHIEADPDCEGCHGSGWLTVQVDHPAWLEEAGLDEPADFCMKCGECEVFDDDDEAREAAKAAGMNVSDYGVVHYTQKQYDFLG